MIKRNLDVLVIVAVILTVLFMAYQAKSESLRHDNECQNLHELAMDQGVDAEIEGCN